MDVEIVKIKARICSSTYTREVYINIFSRFILEEIFNSASDSILSNTAITINIYNIRTKSR